MKLLLALIVFALLLSGCAKKTGDGFVGKWKMEQPEALKKLRAKLPATYMELKGDGSFEITADSPDPRFGSEGGTWKLDGDNIDLTLTQMQGKPATGRNAKTSKCPFSNDHHSFTWVFVKFNKV